MAGICRAVEIGGVACVTGGWRSAEHVIRVTLNAFQGCMHTGQRVTSELKVIELRSEPRIHRVAVLAGCGEAQGHVIDCGCTEILLMARIARR